MDTQPRTRPERCELPALLATSSGFLLSKLGIYVKSCFGQAIVAEGLRPPHYAVLAFLRANDAQPQTTLATVLRIDRSDVVALVDALEQRGLVERGRDPGDRRRYALRLTEQGAELAERLGRVARVTEDEIFAPLSAEERELLLGLLRRLAAHHGIMGVAG